MIKLNYFNCIKDDYLLDGLLQTEICDNSQEKAIKNIILNKARPMMDWLDLPFQDSDFVKEIQVYGKEISEKYENFIVLGIGGSALGAKAIKQALYTNYSPDKQNKKIKVKVIDNVDCEKFLRILQKVNIEKTMFNVVTKSGSTVEILTMFAIVLNKLKAKLGENYYKNIVVTTESTNALWNFSKQNKTKTYEVPKGVGGRYSILCPVGLLPAAVMGIDLTKLLNGARRIYNDFKNQEAGKNLCFKSALINYKYFLKGKREIYLLPYAHRLGKMADFYIQLLSESLGKEKTLSNGQNKLFFTPVKAKGVTYQHSLLQMFQEGPKERLFCFINLGKHNLDIEVPKFGDENLDKYLPDTMVNLMKKEQVGCSIAYKKAGHPSYELEIECLNEENVGALLFYFELTTAIMAELINVNGYDQNGVEMQKKYTKALIGTPGFEKEKEELSKILEGKEKFSN